MQVILLHPHFVTAGGAGRAALEMGSRLAKRGHQVHCICIRADPKIVKDAIPAVEFHEIGGPLSSSLLFWMRFRSSSRRVLELVDQLTASATDAVLFPQVFPANWWAADVLQARPNVPCAWYCPEPSAFIHSRPWIKALPWPKNWIARWARPVLHRIDVAKCRRFRAILVNSDYTAAYARRVYGYTTERCVTVYLGVDHDRFRRLAREERSRAITTVAKLTRFKNVDKIIDAFALLARDGDADLRLNVVGEGDARESLEMQSQRLGLADRVIFHGLVSDATLTSLLQESLVFCLASVEEPFGLVTIEALACGTPAVAVDSGGPREVLRDHNCGVLVPDAEPDSLREALAKILSSSETFETMSKNAVHRAQHFDWSRTVDRVEEILGTVLREHNDQ